ncbi:hypothetical protein Tco_1045576 [Tanacetum coccineum]|uniref:C3H1-type domain-containing protein n=1 Tax=Tanacetum coccineum TaxID=301880 RepID=A0ABQ5GUD3_9ASTR
MKSKADRLANLDLPVKETSVVTYVVNGIRSKYLDAACVTRLREKAPTFNELQSMMLWGAGYVGVGGLGGSCTYGACCKFVHGENDLRPHPPTTGSTAQGRAESNSMSRPSHVVPHMASKTTTSNTNRMVDASVVAQCQSTQLVYSAQAQPTHMGYV